MQARVMSGGFVGAGVLLLMGLPVLWHWHRHKDRRLNNEKLRYEFERIKNDVSEFEADEQGWSYRSKKGHDVRPWEAFIGFSEQDTILILTSTQDVYLLPKRAFTDEQRSELSSRIDNIFQKGAANSLLAAQLRPSAWDYTLALAKGRAVAYTPAGMALFGVGVVGAVALFINQMHWWNAEETRDNLLLSVTCMLLILWFFVSPLTNLPRYRRDVQCAPSIAVTVTPDTIFLRTPRFRQLLKFEHFTKYKETKRAFMFFYDDDRLAMLSKRGLDSKQLQTFREVLNAKIQPGHTVSE